jgi:hypothetical protein
VWRFLKKVKIEAAHDPAILLLSTSPKACKSGYKKIIFISMFIHNSKAMETAQMPSTNEWIKKMWYLYTMQYYSIKKNENFWMELENIMLSEVSQVQKHKGHMFSFICDRSKYIYIYIYIYI